MPLLYKNMEILDHEVKKYVVCPVMFLIYVQTTNKAKNNLRYIPVWGTRVPTPYTRHDTGWSTIIKERLKQLYIMLKHSLFPLQTDGPGLQAALDHLNHYNNQI